jgi:hypothetical protein
MQSEPVVTTRTQKPAGTSNPSSHPSDSAAPSSKPSQERKHSNEWHQGSSTGGRRGNAHDRSEKLRVPTARGGTAGGAVESRRGSGGRAAGPSHREHGRGLFGDGGKAGRGGGGGGGGFGHAPSLNGMSSLGSNNSGPVTTGVSSVPMGAVPMNGVPFFPGVPFGVVAPPQFVANTPGQPQIPDSQPAALEMLRNQVTFYFSIENLLRDTFLRRQMSGDGWVPVDFIASFQRCRHFVFWLLQWDPSMHSVYAGGAEVAVIVAALAAPPATAVEVSDDRRCIRRRENWQQWVLAPAQRDVRFHPGASPPDATATSSESAGAPPPAPPPPPPPALPAAPPPVEGAAVPAAEEEADLEASGGSAQTGSSKPPRPRSVILPPAATGTALAGTAITAAAAVEHDEDDQDMDDMFAMDEHMDEALDQFDKVCCPLVSKRRNPLSLGRFPGTATAFVHDRLPYYLCSHSKP